MGVKVIQSDYENEHLEDRQRDYSVVQNQIATMLFEPKLKAVDRPCFSCGQMVSLIDPGLGFMGRLWWKLKGVRTWTTKCPHCGASNHNDPEDRLQTFKTFMEVGSWSFLCYYAGGMVVVATLITLRIIPNWSIAPFIFSLTFLSICFLLIEGFTAKHKQALLQQNARFERRAPILLLRSFVDSPLARTGVTRFGGERYGAVVGGGRLVTSIDRWVDQIGRPIAFGSKADRVTSGTHEVLFLKTSNETWWPKFHIAARLSSLIVVVPELTRGLLNEVHYLIEQGFENKLLVIMPPTGDGFNKRKFTDRWELVRREWQKEGFELPAYEKRGMVFIPNRKMNLVHAQRLNAGGGSDVSTEIMWATLNCCQQLNPDRVP